MCRHFGASDDIERSPKPKAFLAASTSSTRSGPALDSVPNHSCCIPGPQLRTRPSVMRQSRGGLRVGRPAHNCTAFLDAGAPPLRPFARCRTIPAMEKTLQNILGEIRRTNAPLAPDALDRIIRARNREVAGPVRYVAKKKLLPFYQEAKEHRPEQWHTWGVSPAEEALLVRTLQVKPRRTASGVATVTVLTKPWPCSSACLYCPNDVRMPKSYLHDEPACQRAERNWFDPYLQVTARLRTLHQMGHVTDKVELIVLGGTWSDFPEAYQIWYMHELFRALNDMGCETTVERKSETRRTQYRDAGIACERDDLANWAAEAQARVTAGDASYNETVRNLYACGTHADDSRLRTRTDDRNTTTDNALANCTTIGDTQKADPESVAPEDPQDAAPRNSWAAAAQWQTATFPQLEALQRENESAEHRCVGLVVETRRRRHAQTTCHAAPSRLHEAANGHSKPGPAHPRRKPSRHRRRSHAAGLRARPHLRFQNARSLYDEPARRNARKRRRRLSAHGRASRLQARRDQAVPLRTCRRYGTDGVALARRLLAPLHRTGAG